MTDPLTFPGLPAGTDADTDTVEGFSLDDVARFATRLAVAGPTRAHVLRARGVDEAGWALAEVGWMTRIARKAFAGDRSLLEAYRASSDAELAALTKERPLPPEAVFREAEALREGGKSDGQIARTLDLPLFELARMRLAYARTPR